MFNKTKKKKKNQKYMHSAEVHLVSRYSNVFLNFHITNVIIIIEKKKKYFKYFEMEKA